MHPFNTAHRAPRPRVAGRAWVALLAAPVLALAGLSPAAAVNVDHGSAVVSDDPANFTPQVMNGSVQSFVQIEDKIVVAGTFSTVRQSPTSADIRRNGIFAFNATTGVIDAGFDPDLGIGGSANSLDTDGKHVYVGGSFNSVGGQTVRRVAKLTPAGDLVPGLSTPNSAVNEVVVRGDRLFIGGKFTVVGNEPRGAFAALDTGTGAVLTDVNVPFEGVYNGGGTGITRMDIDPAGNQVVAIGNFNSVAGSAREQIAIVDIPAGGPAALSSWSTERYSQARNNCAGVFDTWTRDIDISPDGTYFVVTTTGAFAGGAGSGTLCDTTSRWELGRTGGSQQPSWVNYTGGDTTYGVAITGSVVYTGGHMRWQNNPFQADQAGPGAVPREGISALDPVNGLPLSWNPGRERGVGAQALYATSQGLWVGSDTRRIAGELRQRVALMPLAGGKTINASTEPVLPNDVFAAARSAADASGVLHRVNTGGGSVQSGDAGPDWSSDTGFVSGGNPANWGSGVPFDATVPASTPAQIFATERWSPHSYDLPVTAGKKLTVRLYFANQCGCTAAVGKRVFDVSIDGRLVLDDFDIVAAVGDKRGTMREFTITSDDIVDIDLTNNVENALINGIEIIDTEAAAGTTVQGSLVKRSVDGAGTPSGTGAVVNTEMDWSLVRGATLADGTLYYGLPNGALYARSFNPTNGVIGAQRAVNLYDDPDTGERIPFAIPNLTGMVFDASTHRLYYTTFGDSRLFYRYFTPESEVVGAQTFVADAKGINFSSAAGLALASGQLLYGSSADGALRSVAFAAGAITGSASVVSNDGTWRYRDIFVSPLAAKPVNKAPTASFTASCDDQRVCSFNATGSTDSDGTIESYVWDFDDTTDPGTGATPSHTYDTDGTYTVTLTVTDNDGATATVTHDVPVAFVAPPANQAPEASFTEVCDNLTCSFDGSASTDPDGTIESYAWDFGDGGSENLQKPNHSYAAAGTYPVTLTVTDDDGAIAVTTREVTVSQAPPANTPPVAELTTDCSGLTCSFDGSGSNDSDGTIESYAWDFGDGSIGDGVQTQHTYTAAGDYPVTLTVTDNQGATGQGSQTVTVSEAPPAAGTIGFRGAASVSGNLITTEVTIPDSVQVGDAIVLSLTQNGPRDISAPTGAGTWTDHGTEAGDKDQIRTTNWTKVAESGDAGKRVSVTLSSRAKVTLSLVAYSGTNASNPVASYAAASEMAYLAQHTTPGANAVPEGAWIISGWADKSSSTADWTDPTGETERVQPIGPAAGRVTAQITDSGPVATGDYAGLTATALTSTGAASKSRKAITWTLVLQP